MNDDAEAAAFFARRAAVVMPSSVPAGVRIELMRARLMTGKAARTDEWMRMLNDRYDECVTRSPASGWLSRRSSAPARSTAPSGSTTSRSTAKAVDCSTRTQAASTPPTLRSVASARSRGWEILDPQLFTATPLVRAAMIRAATDPFGDTG